MLHNTPLKRSVLATRIHDIIYSKLKRREPIKVGDSLFETDPRDILISKKLELYGSYEPYMQDILIDFAEIDSTVLDIGANIGLYSIALAKKVGPNGSLIAFEPDPDNYNILQRNILLNNMTNITPYSLALGDKKGNVLLFQDHENRGALSLCKKNMPESDTPSPEPVNVEIAIGDELLSDINNVSLIKIDVEGAEPMVIKGINNLINRNPNLKIVFEFSPGFVKNFGVEPLDFLCDLENRGFKLSIIDENKNTLVEGDANNIIKIAKDSIQHLNLIASRV